MTKGENCSNYLEALEIARKNAIEKSKGSPGREVTSYWPCKVKGCTKRAMAWAKDGVNTEGRITRDGECRVKPL
jgi:hypothetical protein